MNATAGDSAAYSPRDPSPVSSRIDGGLMSDQNAPRYGDPNQSPDWRGQPNPGWETDPVTGRPVEPLASGPMQPMPDPGPQQPWSQPTPPAPPKKTQWLRIGILVAIVAAIGIGLYVFSDRLSTGVADLGVGHCIDEPSGSDAISDVQRQPCNEPHDGEIFAVLRHPAAPGAPYPLSSEFDDLVSDECVPQLESYTGRSVSEVIASGLFFSYLYPTSTSWSNGDRGVTCYVTKADDTKLIGSIKASGSSAAPGTSAPASP
jgi:hypothetical protein